MILLWEQDQTPDNEKKEKIHERTSQINKLTTLTLATLIKNRKSNEVQLLKQNFIDKTTPLN
jgi:hypothetical protein